MRYATIPLAFLLSACTPGGGIDGIWVITYSTPTIIANTVLCDETYKEADCPDSDGSVTGAWDISQSSNVSEGAFVAEIMGSTHDQSILIIEDELYLGNETDKGTWVFQWDSFADAELDREHDGADYNYLEATSASVSHTFTFTLDDGNKGFSGTHIEDDESTFTAEESDKWDTFENDVYDSVLDDFAVGMLYGIVFNDPEETDCSGSDCSVTYDVTQKTSWALKGIYTDYNDGSEFDGVRTAGQEPGTYIP
jgi:hypothetical protein